MRRAITENAKELMELEEHSLPERFDYKYYGQFDPPVDQFLHERYFRDDPRGRLLIECGAFDGIMESSGYFFEQTLGWTAINLEPSPRIFAELSRNRPDAINLNLALSSQVGESDFRDVNHPGFELCTNGSLEHQPEHLQALVDSGCTFDSSVVATTTLAAFLHGFDISDVELMILDVEGHEIDALEGFKKAPTLPRILCIEHGHLGVDFLREHVEPLGYRFDTAKFVNSFYVRC